jgi:hypothetical protein
MCCFIASVWRKANARFLPKRHERPSLFLPWVGYCDNSLIMARFGGAFCTTSLGVIPIYRNVTLKERFMKKVIAVSVSVSLALMGCATASKNIAASYVSPMQYQSYDCEQLASETQRIHVRVNQLGGRLDEAASNDKVITGVGLILFWPALFALGGTKQQEADYARLKGEYDAVQQTAVVKKCPSAVSPTQPTAEPTLNKTAQAT